MLTSRDNYIKRLNDSRLSKTLIKTDGFVCLMSGASMYNHCELSLIQKQFLEEISNNHMWINMNLPYNDDLRETEVTYPSIFKASLNNIGFFIHCIYNRSMRESLFRHLDALCNRKNGVIITQSSGLNVLTQYLKHRKMKLEKIRVVALGPVSVLRASDYISQLFVVKGENDHYSKILDRQAITKWVSCGHHNYLESEEVIKYVRETVKENTN